MLYDKRWDKTEVKADPFSLENFIAWLERQPADRTYDYTEPYECLLCQYFTAMGFDHDGITMNHLWKHGGGWIEFPDIFRDIANDKDETFGGALERARAAR